MFLNYPKTLHKREYIATALLIISGIVHLKFHIYIYIYIYTSRPNTHLNLGLPAPLTKDQFQ